MKRVIGLAMFVCSIGVPLQAEAVTISVDPGPVGTSATRISMPFNDFNGTALNGQTFDFAFVFSGEKEVEASLSASYSYQTQVKIFTDAGGSPGMPGGVPSPIFLSDQSGLPIVYALGEGAGHAPAGYFYFFGQFEADASGVAHRGVHFEDAIFPTNPTVDVTGAELLLTVTDPSGSLTVVGEPSTLLLAVAGLAVLGWYSRRKRQAL